MTFYDKDGQNVLFIHCISITSHRKKLIIGIQLNTYCLLPRFFSERFDAVLGLQTCFSTKIDNPHPRQLFRNAFLMSHSLANLYVYTIDVLEYIPELPKAIYHDANLQKIDFNFYVRKSLCGTP